MACNRLVSRCLEHILRSRCHTEWRLRREPAVDLVAAAVQRRWQEVHNAGTETTPLFRPVDLRFQEFIRKVEVVFHPDIAGRERALDELSDGQRSLFH